jgi:hypothetical protein
VRRAWALAVALVAACGSRGPGLDRERAAAVFSRVAVDTGGVHGLSGLAVDGDGRLWTVAERGAVAFAITVDGGVSTARRHPIAGLPPGEDLEAVAVADDGGLWLGTEGRDRGRRAGVSRRARRRRLRDRSTGDRAARGDRGRRGRCQPRRRGVCAQRRGGSTSRSRPPAATTTVGGRRSWPSIRRAARRWSAGCA